MRSMLYYASPAAASWFAWDGKACASALPKLDFLPPMMSISRQLSDEKEKTRSQKKKNSR